MSPAYPLASLSSSNLFFSPLPPNHEPPAGKANHGRYMLTIPWSAASGWGQARIEPRHELAFDPLSGVLQYAVTCFEGMKVGLAWRWRGHGGWVLPAIEAMGSPCCRGKERRRRRGPYRGPGETGQSIRVRVERTVR
jgi:hypothetical protein